MFEQSSTDRRAKITQSFSFLIIEIPAKKYWFGIAFFCLWMCCWLYGEIAVIKSILNTEYNSDSVSFTIFCLINNVYAIFWLIGWTIAGAYFLRILLQMLTGIEIIELSQAGFTIKKSILGIPCTEEYVAKHIHNVRMNSDYVSTQDFQEEDLKNEDIGAIQFDYRGKIIRLANEISIVEAQFLLQKMKNTNFLDKEQFA